MRKRDKQMHQDRNASELQFWYLMVMAVIGTDLHS